MEVQREGMAFPQYTHAPCGALLRSWGRSRRLPHSCAFRTYPPSYQFMVYLRHHGFPSPLLDWTKSPYIALHFAYADSLPDIDVAVYAYISLPEGGKSGWGGAPAITEQGSYVTAHARHFRQQAAYTVCVEGEGHKLTYCSHEKVFQSGNERHDLLRKYILPSKLRVEVLRRLRLMNINTYSLFASEEGLMHALAVDEITLKDR